MFDSFGEQLRLTVTQSVRLLKQTPYSAAALARIAAHGKKAASERARHLEEGVQVPPILILSTTAACNLNCAGCYSRQTAHMPGTDLPPDAIHRLVDEAAEIGVAVLMLAGGEPLLAPEWLHAAARHPGLLTLLFTNGTLLDDARARWLAEHRHILPVFSLEGTEVHTDLRRGEGVHAAVQEAILRLTRYSVPFGVSITTTAENLEFVTSPAFLEENFLSACRLFLYVEYVPAAPNTLHLVLDKQQKQQLTEHCRANGKRYPALFLPFPGDEALHDGCLAAGRGFVYMSPSGDLQPCPFAPFSDRNISGTSLLTALRSPLLRRIRAQHHTLREGVGGCALRSNADWVAQALEEKGVDN
ncbi:radical SAM/SPASM domain-containing protein [Gorillibacterium massiliense]|uniref:radical SAM/SPASM domain-containing protein n=1 Tax=Gorillibacterium massiliense TaxID=1280390 RepID=UPI0004AEBA22|nr:radical SAM protein [Gorillibacterium massiliense]